VYAWDEDRALVQTVDFFTPVVDDPYLFGQIAAANALSDVYAMGARPLTALAVAAIPAGALDPDQVKAIFRGGYDKLLEAGVVLLGGHTVQDREVKFGYAVTGVVHPQRIWRNAGAAPGDSLLLTKPLGTGIIATAIKFQRAPADAVTPAERTMATLNAAAAEAAASLPAGSIHACTDVTGFGLVGHATEIANASRVTVEIRANAVPLLPRVLELAQENRSGGLNSNREYFGAGVAATETLDQRLIAALYDPQTSGGLLFSVAADHVNALRAGLETRGVEAAVVGRVIPRGALAVHVD
jgi:selenide,water dikinase